MDPQTQAAIIDSMNAASASIQYDRASRRNQKSIEQNNYTNRLYNQGVYLRTRADSLADEKRQNEYNSPKQQMERLKEAGLNPRLMYGSSSGFTPAATVKPSDTGNYKSETATRDATGQIESLKMMGDVMQRYVELTSTQAKTDNLRQQRELLEEQTNAVRAGIPKTKIETETSQYNLDYAKKTQPQRIKKLDLDNEQSGENIKFTQQSYQKLLQDMDKSSAEEKHVQMLKKIAEEDYKLKQYEVLLRSLDINPNSTDIYSQLKKQLQTVSQSSYYYGKLYDIYNSKSPVK